MNLKKIILLFFVMFLVGEVFLNVIDVRPNQKNFGWKNAHDTYEKFIKKIDLNEFGTRDIKIEKRKKIPNIILLGDSQVELAQKAKNMPARILEDVLKETYNVYSLGSWGWGNDQQLLILNKTIKKIKPEYVILFFTPNDIENNYNNIGFKGEKPTFKISDNYKISEPKYFFIKSLLNLSWTYRTIYRVYLLSKKKKYENFIDDKSFLSRKKCNETNHISLEELLNNYSDYSYLRKKYLEITKMRGEKINDEKTFKKNIYKLLITRNRYKPEDDKLFYFRDIQSKEDKKQIYLTNFLLKEIQKISKDNNSKFILINVINKNYYFKNDSIYSICIQNKLIEYSNKYYEDFFNKIFNGLENVISHNIERGYEEYDLIDGHLNYKTNKEIFLKVADKIKNK